MPPLAMAALAAAAFVLSHLLIAGTRLRDTAVGAVGQRAYTGLYSLLSLAALIWMIAAFGAARSTPANAAFWAAPAWARWLQLGLQLLAMMLVVGGLTTPNPTSVAQEGVLDRPQPVRGLTRITRHPFLWGVAIWAIGHILVTGAPADLILFGAMLALALLGPPSIDAKRRRALGERWQAFAGQTSNIPFAAIAAGRQSLNLAEIGWVRLGGALVAWAALIAAHRFLFGVAPLP